MQVQAKIQKWGNSLGLRLSGVLRDLPHFVEGTKVEIEVNEEGFILKKARLKKTKFTLPYTEKELLTGMVSQNDYADLLVNPLKSESVD